MSHFSKKILEEAMEREKEGIEYFPGDADLNNLEDIIKVAAYFQKEYGGATAGKVLEVLKDNVDSNNIQQALIFLYLGNESQAESLLANAKDGFDYYDSIISYVKSTDMQPEVLSFLIDVTVDSYKSLRMHDDIFYKEYAKNNLLHTVKSLDEVERISIVKELARVDVIRAKAISLDEISVENMVVDSLLEEVDVIIKNKGSKLKSIMSLENPIEQDVLLKEKELCWELENKTIRKLNDWITRAKEVILTTSLNVMSNPTTKKLAVGALVVGVALGSSDAMADMTDAADNLNKLGDMLADKIGNIEEAGNCNIGTEIWSESPTHVSGRLTLGDYVIDFDGKGFDAGTMKSSNVATKIGRLKAETDCTLSLEDAKSMAKTVEKIIKHQ